MWLRGVFRQVCEGLSPERVFCPKPGLTFAPLFHTLPPLSQLHSAFLLMVLPAITFTTWNKPNQPPLPKAPGFTSRSLSLLPFCCRVPLQLHGECGFPLKFSCCLALYWLSPLVVYHQQIWQVHSWFLHCSRCWLETKRGLIEPFPSTHLLHSPYSHGFFWRWSLPGFWLLHPKNNWRKRRALQDYSPATWFCVHTP